MKKLIKESINQNKLKTIEQGILIICDDLGFDECPKITLIDNMEFTSENKSFACYIPSEHEVVCVIKNRNTADCLRSIAHELMHHKQNLEGRLNSTSGKDGDDVENEANSYSGKIMRRLGRELDDIFDIKVKLNEGKSIKNKLKTKINLNIIKYNF